MQTKLSHCCFKLNNNIKLSEYRKKGTLPKSGSYCLVYLRNFLKIGAEKIDHQPFAQKYIFRSRVN